MRGRKFIIFLLILPIALIAGSSIMADMKPVPGADAVALWKHITEENPYLGYHCWPGKKGFYKGREPHGAILRTFVSPKAWLDIHNQKGKFSDGSIIVKENYMPNLDLGAITVMYKIKGYDPANNDWYWVKYDQKGKALMEGKVKGCINCHGSTKDNDYVFSGKLK